LPASPRPSRPRPASRRLKREREGCDSCYSKFEVESLAGSADAQGLLIAFIEQSAVMVTILAHLVRPRACGSRKPVIIIPLVFATIRIKLPDSEYSCCPQ
jgi:hypothetical protein